jgi:hypothetical protein
MTALIIGPFLVSASVSGANNCKSGLEIVNKELATALDEEPPRQGENADESTLADWRHRVTDKAIDLADKVAACRQLKVPEREKLLNQALNAVIRATGQESYIPTRKAAAEDIIHIAEKMVTAKVPVKSTGWALDRAQDILIDLKNQKEREAKVGFENYMWGSIDLGYLTNQIAQIRERIGYWNLGKAK